VGETWGKRKEGGGKSKGSKTALDQCKRRWKRFRQHEGDRKQENEGKGDKIKSKTEGGGKGR